MEIKLYIHELQPKNGGPFLLEEGVVIEAMAMRLLGVF